MGDKPLPPDGTVATRMIEEANLSATPRPLENAVGKPETRQPPTAPGSPNAELTARIEQALAASGYPPLHNLRVCAAEGLVILRGMVPTYFLKQMAQATAAGVDGVCDVYNEVDVGSG